MKSSRCTHPYPCDHGLDAYKNDTCRCIICRQAVAIRYAPAPTVIDGTGTQRRIQALAFIGYPIDYIQKRLGQRLDPALTLGTRPTVTAGTARAVLALYNQAWKYPQEEASETRAYAKSMGWVGPLNWDDDTIEDPATKPVGVPKPADYQKPERETPTHIPGRLRGPGRKTPFEDIEEMIRDRRPMDEILEYTGTTADALFRRIHRANRKDLFAYIPEPRRYYAKTATSPGRRIPA